MNWTEFIEAYRIAMKAGEFMDGVWFLNWLLIGIGASVFMGLLWQLIKRSSK